MEKEAVARIKIDKLLQESGWRFFDSEEGKLKEVPDSIKLNDKQTIQREVSKSGKRHTNKEQIKSFLDNLQYPIYYLDFETINPAIPKFDGMKSYQRIPFQFSLHIQEEPKGELKHISFLAEGKEDPRKDFIDSLIKNLGDKGDILVYNQSFEKGVLSECIDGLNLNIEWLRDNIFPRVKDLLDIFKEFQFYDPRQNGSASIKAVLPVLSDLSYNDLEINKGEFASYEWERITFLEDINEEEKLKVRNSLEKYCELDTLAEVEIVNGLREIE
jgi:hypothetical protein